MELDLMRPLETSQAAFDKRLQFARQCCRWLKTLAYHNTSHGAGKLLFIRTRHHGRFLHCGMVAALNLSGRTWISRHDRVGL